MNTLKKHFEFQISENCKFLSLGLHKKDGSLIILKFGMDDLDSNLISLYNHNWKYVIGTWIPIFEKRR